MINQGVSSCRIGLIGFETKYSLIPSDFAKVFLMAFEILFEILSAHIQIFKVANNESMNIKELLYKFLRIFMTPRNVA